ncbi:type I-E CRISPR-associated protein Cse1/CasA [Mycobacterium canetti]|uniref:type I-E CRISPR-associated protein Cse1/CasA n=1 Tax=Mycobacterium canetti TaxID=78331 RepID=UPI00034AB1D4|nr:type I-E CRISPR-associated protein Cse1/CasA [Mycobacterium canetti]
MTRSNGFNLLDEPWIAVLDTNGHEDEVSILELFNQADRFITIGGEVPTQAFAITRLLLAFLHRAIDGPTDQDDWVRLWNADHLPMESIRAYADRVRRRFDLFDPVAPFYQVADLRTAKNEVSGLERIVADVPSGARLFTTRSSSSLERIRPAEAARWLVHVHAFDPSGIKSGAVGDPNVKAGKGYPIGPGWCGQLGGVLADGGDLRRTLILNLIARDAETYVRTGNPDDIPPWERDPDSPQWKERPPRGAIDLYTWQTQRIRLIGDHRGVVGVVLANGDKIQPQNRHGLEPHSAWRFSEPQSKKHKVTTYMPLLHDPGRSVWRGIGALLPATSRRRSGDGEPQPFLAPGVLEWIADLAAQGHLPETFKPGIRALGVEYGDQNATFAEVVDDQLPIPLHILRVDRPAAGRTAVEAVEDADKAASSLWRLAENIAQAAGAEPKSGAGDTACERLYAALDEPYRRWLATLMPGTDLSVARRRWQAVVREEVDSIAAELVSAASPAAWVGREVRSQLINVALAEAWFVAALRRTLPLAQREPTTTPEEVTT